jgi:hypothetical protein
MFKYNIEIIHFNPKYPEYHNIFIPKINERYGMKYIDGDWTLIEKNELVDDVYEDKKEYVVENLDDFIEHLDENKKRSLNRWLDTEDDNESVKNTKEDIKKLLYENRKMAMDRKKELENMNKKILTKINLNTEYNKCYDRFILKEFTNFLIKNTIWICVFN